MLLLTCRQFYLKNMQFYLQGSQSAFQNRKHQVIVLTSIKAVHVA